MGRTGAGTRHLSIDCIPLGSIRLELESPERLVCCEDEGGMEEERDQSHCWGRRRGVVEERGRSTTDNMTGPREYISLQAGA